MNQTGRQRRTKKLPVEYEDPESDEDVNLCDAIFKRAVKRGHAKMIEIIDADMKPELEFHGNENQGKRT